jgi:hypothetical protein
MANTFGQLHVQFVFAVQNQISLIQPSWEEEMNSTESFLKNLISPLMKNIFSMLSSDKNIPSLTGRCLSLEFFYRHIVPLGLNKYS